MKGGINFEEWKEIVKKNRRSLRSKSNIFRFEPESLTYGAEKAVKSPEYGQVHTITYNVTGMSASNEWPSDVKSGHAIRIPNAIPYGKMLSEININTEYTFDDRDLVINNVQNNLNISIKVENPDYTKANLGDYLYEDKTFGETPQSSLISSLDKNIARCIATSEEQFDSRSIWAGLMPDTKKFATSDTYFYPNRFSFRLDTMLQDKNGLGMCHLLRYRNGSFTYDSNPAIKDVCEAFGGNGYIPAYGELVSFIPRVKEYVIPSDFTSCVWTSTCVNTAPEGRDVIKRAPCIKFDTLGYTTALNKCTNTTIRTLGFVKLGPFPTGALDLMLPSGTLWGSSYTVDHTKYYGYGQGTIEIQDTQNVYSGMENPLSSSADSITQTKGGKWHTPTKEQFEELVLYMERGFLRNLSANSTAATFVTWRPGRENQLTLIVPLGGYYDENGTYRKNNRDNVDYPCCRLWTSTPDSDDPTKAYCFGIERTSEQDIGNARTILSDRSCGYNVISVLG